MSRIPVLVMNDTRVDNHHGCFSVMTAIERLLEANGMEAVAFWPAHAEWRGNATFEAALQRARLVIVNGEGTLHHDLPAGRRLLELGSVAKSNAIPAALINTGWEANGPEFSDMLRDFALISARDSLSAKAMGVKPADVRVVPDLSFYFAQTNPENPRQHASKNRDGIGFTDNVDRFKVPGLERLRRACNGRTISIAHGDDDSYLRFLRDGISIREDLKKPGFALALLRARHQLWTHRFPDTTAFLKTLSEFQLIVSGRFHACTLALTQGTPFVAQSSNTGKIAALARDAGLDEWRTSIMSTKDEIVKAAAHGWSKAETENRLAYIGDARLKAEMLFADLRKLAG
jgi:polysaccharide pyruvyl transferase WcaK-like protein